MSETPAVARELSLEFAIDEALEKLWHALTEPRIVEQWLAPVVRNDPTTAGFSCELLATDPGRSVSYRWRDPDLGESIVTFGGIGARRRFLAAFGSPGDRAHAGGHHVRRAWLQPGNRGTRQPARPHCRQSSSPCPPSCRLRFRHDQLQQSRADGD